jgi:hypothetical protein
VDSCGILSLSASYKLFLNSSSTSKVFLLFLHVIGIYIQNGNSCFAQHPQDLWIVIIAQILNAAAGPISMSLI